MRVCIWRAAALATVGIGLAAPAEQDQPPAYTATLVRLPRAARQDIVRGDDRLKKHATRILRDGKPVLDVWLPSHVPPPDGLFDGSLLAILAPPRRPRPHNMVTVRTIHKAMKVDFSTIDREEADRAALKLQRSVKTWRRLDVAQPLALVTPEEPLWRELPADGPRVALHEAADEVHLTLVLQPDEKRGARWQLPPRVRKILGL